MKESKGERHKQLLKLLDINPFHNDEELATLLHVSVPTIRLDRMELNIPELRERMKNVAFQKFENEVRTLSLEEVIGEVIDLKLDESGISIFDVKPEHVFQRNQIMRGHHLFAQANSLAVAIIKDNLALTSKANVQFLKPVLAGDRVIAKASVTNIDEKKERTSIHVESFVQNHLVFVGDFELFRKKSLEE